MEKEKVHFWWKYITPTHMCVQCPGGLGGRKLICVSNKKNPNYALPLAVIDTKMILNSLFNEFSD